MARTLLIVGASGRAAAASAVRSGWQPVVIDLFADEDTRALGPVLQCPLADYPHGFLALAERALPGPWMYTGGLENDPAIVVAISRNRKLLGVPPEVLELVRDPFRLAAILPMPAMRKSGELLDPGKRWLRKPLRGSGGFGIEAMESSPGSLAGRASDGGRSGENVGIAAPFPGSWPSLTRSANGSSEGNYAQEWVAGSSNSALYLFTESGPPALVGICSQLIGETWLNAPLFRYCGNIGPLPMDSGLSAELRGIGNALQPLGLRGLIGIDFIRSSDGIRVLEINPRYTASVELYERSSGRTLLAEHIEALASKLRALPWAENFQPVGLKIHGKAILYAERRFEVPSDHPWHGPSFADIPAVGSVIPSGQPVVTLFASADTEPECREQLKLLAQRSAPR